MTTLRWTCRACDKPIEGDPPGVALIPMGDVHRAEKADAEWTAAHTDADGLVTSNVFEPGPGPALWAAYHRECAPPDDVADYWFGLERCRTGDDLLMWTLHLMEKTWLPATNWDTFAAGVARDSGIQDR